MNDEEKLLAARLKDLAERSYKNNIYTNTQFLTLAEQQIYFRIEKELKYATPELFGGGENTERKIVRFGSPDLMGYEEDFPVKVLYISPLMQKFADELSHRDFLGAVLNLGIERCLIGDIWVRQTATVMFVMEHVAEMIRDELIRIRHTSVKTEIRDVKELDAIGFAPEFELIRESVASMRADLVISKVCRMSRSDSQRLFELSYVAVNGRILVKPETELKAGDVFTVRGHGKYIFDGTDYVNKKGRNSVIVRRYK